MFHRIELFRKNFNMLISKEWKSLNVRQTEIDVNFRWIFSQIDVKRKEFVFFSQDPQAKFDDMREPSCCKCFLKLSIERQTIDPSNFRFDQKKNDNSYDCVPVVNMIVWEKKHSPTCNQDNFELEDSNISSRTSVDLSGRLCNFWEKRVCRKKNNTAWRNITCNQKKTSS